MPLFLEVGELGQPAAQLFGRRLRRHRQALGLTQGDLFERTGVNAAYVSLIERGRANPTLDMMVRLAEAVGAEVWDMIRPGDDATADLDVSE